MLKDVVENCPKEYASVTLGYAPPYGETRYISSVEVGEALKSWGLYDFKLVGEGVKVVRKSDFIRWEEALPLVRKFLLTVFGEATVELKEEGGLFCPPGSKVFLDYDPRFPTNWRDYRLVVKGRNFKRSFPLSEVFSIKVRVWVAKEDLKRGEKITLSKVESVLMDLNRVPVDVLECVEGKEALFEVKAGTVLTRSLVRGTLLVRKGEKVRGVVRVGAVVVRLWAVALDDGGEGDLIRLKTDEGRILKGKVIGDGEAEIL
jgi:flagella basal body P-ring formation protein FlgA